ncbi:MAG: hypothetical protein R3F53_24205 [Gammaproteobacteria bacterium]
MPPTAFARHEPGADVILFGTGDQTHLASNINSILGPPLPQADVRKAVRIVRRTGRNRSGSASQTFLILVLDGIPACGNTNR